MTLDEAIEMSERIGSGDSERAANNRWLAGQLRLLKFVEETHVIDEAARARREMHKWQLMWKRAEAENAKLREFAQAMAEVAYEGQMLCDKCRFSHGCYNGGKKEHEGRGCQWLLWARELGIEADDD